MLRLPSFKKSFTDLAFKQLDGKKEFDYGIEELDKRWKGLKKAINNSTSIMSMDSDDEEVPDEQGY